MDQCCERQKHLFYVFDWDTNTWKDEYITSVSTNEMAGASVEISTYYLNEKKQCTNIKWPKCIEQNVDYVASNFIVHYKLLQHAVSELFGDFSLALWGVQLVHICFFAPDCIISHY